MFSKTNCFSFPLYFQCRLNEENLWTDLLLRILDQKDWLITSNSHKFFEKLLEGKDILSLHGHGMVWMLTIFRFYFSFSDILKYIVKTKDLATVLRIIPVKKSEIGDSDTHTSESVERFEDKIFAEYLKMAIDKDRANRLSDMIKTTGHQLYDTYNRNKQFFN